MRLEEKDLPRAFRASRAFVIINSGEREGKCGHWGELDRFGYCLDDGCRAERLIKDLQAGRARKLADGTLVWNVEA